jgi:hypothetical protein
MRGTAQAIDRPDEKSALRREWANLDHLAQRLATIRGNLADMIDRVWGPTPEGTEKTGPSAVPSGLLGEINEQHERVASLLGDIDAAVIRLKDLA